MGDGHGHSRKYNQRNQLGGGDEDEEIHKQIKGAELVDVNDEGVHKHSYRFGHNVYCTSFEPIHTNSQFMQHRQDPRGSASGR